MNFTSKKDKNENTKFSEINRVIGNSAMLQHYALEPTIQCVRYDDIEDILLSGQKELRNTTNAKCCIDEVDETTSSDDNDSDWSSDTDREQIRKEEFYNSLGEITYTLDSINYSIIPNKWAIFNLFDKPETISDYKNQLLNIFLYANTVFKKICNESDITEPFKQFFNAARRDKKITITVLDADPHGFNPPIKLEAGGRAFVYKDRLGHADKIVTDLFKKINSIMEKDLMPAYEQYAFSEKGLLSEFIVGKQRSHPPYPSENFRGNAENLQALQWVAKQIGLTDLHFQNVVFTSNEQIVPVDLEAFEAGMPTGLFPPPLKLPAAASSLLVEAPLSKSLPAPNTETIPDQVATGSSESSDDDFLVLSSNEFALFQEHVSTFKKSTRRKTDVGNPDEIDPLKVFGDQQHFVKISKSIATAQRDLFNVPKRLVPIPTTDYKDSWAHIAQGMSQVSTDMIEKTTAAFKKRKFQILPEPLQTTMSNLVNTTNAIPIFIRKGDEILQFDVTTDNWVRVAVYSHSTSQASPASPESPML